MTVEQPMVSRAGWRWYGYGGHFVGNARCAYHLATLVGEYFVSTVGDYRPRDPHIREPIGSGADALFETMVFRCRGFDAQGNPENDLAEIETVRYADSLAAERGHYAMCEKWAR